MKSFDDLRAENPELMDIIMKPHRVKVVEILNQTILLGGTEGLLVSFGDNDKNLRIDSDNPESDALRDLLNNSLLTHRTRSNLVSTGFINLLVYSKGQLLESYKLADGSY